MGLALRSLWMLCFVCAAACGGGGADDAASGGSSGAGGSGAGGTSASGGPGTLGGSSNGGSGGPVAQTCNALEARISVDGMQFSTPLVQAATIGSANNNNSHWAWSARLGQHGVFSLSGSNAIPATPGQPLDGSPLSIDHALIAPNIGDSLGVMYALAPGTSSQLSRQGNQIDIELQGVATLQDCGQYPVQGQIDLCHRTGGGACPAGAEGGKLDQYAWSDGVTSWIVTDGNIEASVGDQGAHFSALGDASGVGPLKWAYIRTSLYGHYDGKSVCASQAEAVQMTDATGDYTVIHLTNLAWLEGPGSESASGCVR